MKKKTWRDEEKNTHRVKHSHLNICIIIVHNTFITGLKVALICLNFKRNSKWRNESHLLHVQLQFKASRTEIWSNYHFKLRFLPDSNAISFRLCGSADVMCRLKTVFLLIRLFLSDGVLFELHYTKSLVLHIRPILTIEWVKVIWINSIWKWCLVDISLEALFNFEIWIDIVYS